MEDELKCSYCNDFYCNPVLLPCSHSLCYACALNLQEKFSHQNINSNNNNNLQKNTKTKHSNATLNSNCSTLTHNSNDISNNITTAILNAAKSASQMVALSNPNNVSPTSISPHSSISSSSSINIDNICRRTSSTTDLGSSIVSDLDKLSIFSETDSGMVAFHNSTSSANQSIMTTSSINQTRPSSYLSNQSTTSSSSSSSSISPVNDVKTKHKVSFPLHSPAPSQIAPTPLPIFQTTPLYSTYFPCPQCNRMIYMDDSGVESLTRNTCLENIVERYTESKKLSLKCQMCPPASILSQQQTTNSDQQSVSQKSEKDAQYMCEQCEIYYCEECRELCHPMRGPLQKHSLVAAKYGRDLIRRKNRQRESKCGDHPTENVNSYCLLCKCVCCSQCANETVHINHDIQQINTFCKSQKAELSQILQSLSEKAKSATEFVTKLKNIPEIIEENSTQFKTILVNEIDEMIRLLELKKKELCEFVDIEKTTKIKSVKDQVSYLSCKIQKTTGLLQYCVETLKEQDPASFLLISENMITRMSDIENKFPQDGDLQPKVELDFDILLNSDAIYKEIKKLSYKQNKVPSAPVFLAEQCQTSSSLTDSTIILAWNNKLGSKNNVQGYLLEIDDGTPDSSFKEVYCGSDNICQINGLSANLVYNARVKSFNQAGFSEYSNIISLAASPTLWFSFNPKTSHNDAIFSNNFTSLTCMSFEDRVILGSIGFSKGIHYWEVTIDRYDNQPDPAFGVARYDVGKDHMLGKDNKSWCMYIDCKRSWFMHNGKHFNRVDNGIQQGCVIGILLDLNRYQLSYFVNDEPHGNVAFTKLPKGVYYPAFSLNKNVQITLNSGLEPPPSLDNSDCD